MRNLSASVTLTRTGSDSSRVRLVFSTLLLFAMAPSPDSLVTGLCPWE